MAGVKKKSGGKRPNSGRKSKAEEMGLAALLDQCWTLTDRRKCIERLAQQASAGEMEATKLLMAYTYGKPVERKQVTGEDGNALRIQVEYVDQSPNPAH